MDQLEERKKYFEGRTESLSEEVAELRVLLAELKATNAGLEQQLTFMKNRESGFQALNRSNWIAHFSNLPRFI